MKPRDRRPSLSHWFEYSLVRCLSLVAPWAPGCAHAPIARLFGLFWYYVLPIRRRVALANLARAFPGRNAAWRRKVAQSSAAHFVRVMLFEFFALGGKKPAVLGSMLAGIDGLENYERGGGDARALICVTGHLGNWELAAAYFSRIRGRKIAALAKPMHNPLVERLVSRVRRACGWEVISTHEDPLRPILRAVREGRLIVFLADQDARRDGIFVPFFSHPASTARGPAFLACRLGLPIVVGIACRSPEGGRYRLRFHPPIVPDRSAEREAEIERLSRAHVAILEEAIRENPEQYFWFHRRWKTRPKGIERTAE